jgi:hypothetical protein
MAVAHGAEAGMSADVSTKSGWPFMSTTPTKPALPLHSEVLNRADPEEALRAQIFKLLATEGRSMHSGEIALLLQVGTHRIYTAMHHPQQTGKVRFISSEGWSLPPATEKSRDDKQERLA